jgi:DNA uptake protein ComE-like DNA-binding protein
MGALDPRIARQALSPRVAQVKREEENGAVQTKAAIIGIMAWMLGNPTVWTQEQARTPAVPRQEMRVDINHASVEELLRVQGMTRIWAGRIVRFRPYRTKQDLVDRGVVNSDVYNRIKDYIIAHREKQ